MEIVSEKCQMCLTCISVCPVQAVSEKNGVILIDKSKCIECGCCAASCPNEAIKY